MDGLYTAILDFLNTLIPTGSTLQFSAGMLALNELLAYVICLGMIYWLLKKFISLFGGKR